MPLAPARQWYRLHLLTVCLLAALAWLIVSANFQLNGSRDLLAESGRMWGDHYYEYGWPFKFGSNVRGVWNSWNLCRNIALGLSALAFAAFICEFLLRPTPRYSFRMHLSTACLLSVLCGVMFWLNFLPQTTLRGEDVPGYSGPWHRNVYEIMEVTETGFPFKIQKRVNAAGYFALFREGKYNPIPIADMKADFDDYTPEHKALKLSLGYRPPETPKASAYAYQGWSSLGIAANFFFACVVFLIVAVLCEARIQRDPK